MADARELIEHLTAVVDQPQSVAAGQLADMADRYAGLCRGAAQRLRRCKLYLDQGLVGEAIHDAECPPDLLDLTTALDFPRRCDWDRLCAENGLPVGQLPDETASELNEAYVVAGRVRSLLQRQRELVLSGAPLADRLAVVDALATDTGLDVWNAGREELVRAAVHELVDQAKAAGKAGDLEAVQAVAQQLATTPGGRAARQRVQTIQLQLVRERLRRAHEARDLPAARSLHAVHEQLLTQVAAPAPSPSVAAALDWVCDHADAERRQRAFEFDCGALADALDDDGAELDALVAVAQRVERHGEPIPEDLSARYQSTVTAHARAIRRTRTLKILGIAGAFAATVAVVALVVHLILQSRMRDRLAQAIERQLEGGALDDAGGSLQRLGAERPAWLARPRFKALAKRHGTLVAAERDRKATVVTCLNAATAALEAGQLAKADDPLQKVAGLSKGDEEAGQLAALRKRLDEARRALGLKVDDELAKIEQARGPLVALPRSADPRGVRLKALEDLLAWTKTEQVRALDTGLAGLIAKVAALVERLTVDVAAERQQVARDRRVEMALGRIVGASGAPDKLMREHSAFRVLFPRDPLADSFEKALLLSEAWKAVEGWAAIARELGAKPVWGAARLQQLKAYLKAFPGAHNRVAVRTLSAWMESGEFTNPDMRELVGLRADPVLGQLPAWWFALFSVDLPAGCVDKAGAPVTGRRYMSQAAWLARTGPGRYRLTYHTNPARKNATATVQIRVPGDRALKVIPAHVKELLKRLADVAVPTLWEAYYLEPVPGKGRQTPPRDLLAEILKTQKPPVHTVLQTMLLRRVVDYGLLHARGAETQFRQLDGMLPGMNALFGINWLVSDQAGFVQCQPTVARVAERLPGLRKAVNFKANRERLWKVVGTRFRQVGVVLRGQVKLAGPARAPFYVLTGSPVAPQMQRLIPGLTVSSGTPVFVKD